MTWTPTQEARHRAVLWRAIGGKGPVPAPPFPDPARVVPAERDQSPAVCPACLAGGPGSHGPACEGVGCACRCRAMLGLEGPFPFGDPTATGLHDVRDPDEEWVA